MTTPMKANPIEWDKIPTRCAGYNMELKLDGVRGVVIKDVSLAGVRILTNSGQDLAPKLPYLVEVFKQIPGAFMLDGELGYTLPGTWGDMPIIDFNKTMRVIGSGPDEAIRKQEENALPDGHDAMSKSMRFHAFDVLHNGVMGLQDVGQLERHMLLSQWRWDHIDKLPVEFFDVCDWWPVWDEDLYTRYVQLGGEGVILKNPVARYVEGKRPANNWYKVKKFESIDVVISGYTDGQGKYEGMIGAIEFNYQGRKFRCSGMDDATRATLSRTRPTGVMIEVRHFGFVGEDGLRFPQFLRFRPDKDGD